MVLRGGRTKGFISGHKTQGHDLRNLNVKFFEMFLRKIDHKGNCNHYLGGALGASRKWVGTKIFNLSIFQTELCCHCGMKKWVGT